MRDDEGVREAGRDGGREVELGLRPESDGRGASSGHGRVLVIEAGAEAGRPLVEALARAGFSVRVCADGQKGLQAFLGALPDLIVMPMCAEDPEGPALLRDIRAISDVPVVVVGDAGTEQGRNVASALGLDRVLLLPADAEADDVARRAAEVVAEPVGGGDRASGSGVARERAPRPPRLTAAQVRRIARVELAAELERQLVDCRGNLAEMARRMGKDRSTIRYHLRRFGMLVEDPSVRSEQAARAAGDSNHPSA